MNKIDARWLAGMCEEWLNIPSYICEMIEASLIEGKYEEVCKFMVSRTRELKERSDG